MKTGNRSNALLVELLIVVMFFMLAATVLLQVFSAAHTQTQKAGMEIRALNEAQNIADRLYAAQKVEAELTGLGFSREGEIWALDGEEYRIEVTSNWEEREQGRMRVQQVRVSAAGETMLTLPCSRYEEGRQ